MKQAYQFWYKSDVLSPTEYIYVVAETERQAQQIFKARGYHNMYDWSSTSNLRKELSSYGIANYVVGDILGALARL